MFIRIQVLFLLERFSLFLYELDNHCRILDLLLFVQRDKVVLIYHKLYTLRHSDNKSSFILYFLCLLLNLVLIVWRKQDSFLILKLLQVETVVNFHCNFS